MILDSLNEVLVIFQLKTATVKGYVQRSAQKPSESLFDLKRVSAVFSR